MARIDTLGNFLTDVADAIRSKTGDSSTITPADFDTEIENIPSGGGADLSEYFNTEMTANTSDPAYFCITKKCPPITISNNVTSLYNVFNNCPTSALKIIGGNNVTDMNGVFSYSKYLTTLDLSNFNTSNATNMSNMFSACTNLPTLDLSNFNTSNATNMSSMFQNCKALTTLDLSNFNTSNVTNMSSMFAYCKALTTLDLRNFVFTSVTTYYNIFYSVPNDCLIIVKDTTAKDWVMDKNSKLTNVKTVDEYEAEQSGGE